MLKDKAEYIEVYTHKIRHWLQSFFQEKNETITTTERCCLRIGSKNLSLLHIDKEKENLKMLSAETRPYQDLESFSLLLADMVAKNNLYKIPTDWLLQPDDYQLFLIESLAVAPEEIRDALNWRIRSLINYPIEEATLEYFTLPAKKTSPDTPIIAVIVAKATYLQKMIDVIKKSNLTLTTINIPELALKALTSLYEQDEKSSAMIYFYKNTAILNITKEKTLFFTRRINWSPEGNLNQKDIEQISLDLLRYFDYFQSQWRLPAPSRIFVATQAEDPKVIAKSLSGYSLLSIEPYHFKKALSKEKNVNALEENYLLELGSIMSEEED